MRLARVLHGLGSGVPVTTRRTERGTFVPEIPHQPRGVFGDDNAPEAAVIPFAAFVCLLKHDHADTIRDESELRRRVQAIRASQTSPTAKRPTLELTRTRSRRCGVSPATSVRTAPTRLPAARSSRSGSRQESRVYRVAGAVPRPAIGVTLAELRAQRDPVVGAARSRQGPVGVSEPSAIQPDLAFGRPVFSTYSARLPRHQAYGQGQTDTERTVSARRSAGRMPRVCMTLDGTTAEKKPSADPGPQGGCGGGAPTPGGSGGSPPGKTLWAQLDSNQRLLVCKTSALTTELCARAAGRPATGKDYRDQWYACQTKLHPRGRTPLSSPQDRRGPGG